MPHPNRKPDPSPEEIRERMREVREDGFVYDGDFFPAWGDNRYYHRAQNDLEQRVPFDFPVIPPLDEHDDEEEWFSEGGFHTLDTGP